MKTCISLPRSQEIIDLYNQAINHTQLYFKLLNSATDPTLKQQWIRAGLLDENYGAKLIAQINATPEGERIRFTMDELITMVTAIDICCKFYLSPLYIKVEKILMQELPEITPQRITKGFTHLLGSFDSMLAELKTVMKGDAKFKKAISSLSKLEIVDFHSIVFDED